MASDHRQPVAAVELCERIRAQPYRFGFLLTLRRLDCLYSDRPPTGLAVRASDEPIRLGQHPGLDFAAANMHSCEPTADQERWVLKTRFLGLFGANGPLPLHLTEFVRDRMRRQHDDTLASFVDIFHHRVLALFYRSWASGQPTVHLDRPDTDRFSVFIGSMIGIGTESFRKRDAVSDHAKLYFSGRLVGQSRNADGLNAIITHFFQLPSRVEQFVGHWMQLPEDSVTRLGASTQSGTLGQSALCGGRIWDTQSKFRLVFGPLDLRDFSRLLPGRPGFDRLIALVRNYIGDEFLWDVRLILKRDSIPATQLGCQGQLGWTSFLVSKRPDVDSEAAVFSPEF
jgi:type VI secretion system protein ImpH